MKKALILAASMVLTPSIAFADTFLGKLTDFGFQVAAPVVTLFGLWLAHRLLKVFEDKTKIEVPAQVQAMIDDWVVKGINLAEEKAQTALKTQANKVTAPEKLELAANFVMDMAKQYGFEDMVADKVKNLVESKLQETRTA